MCVCVCVFKMHVRLNALHEMSPCMHTTKVYACVCACLLSSRWQEWYNHLRINISLKLQPSAHQQTNINTVFSYSAISLSPCIAPLFSLFSLSAVLPSIIIRRRIYDLSTPATTLWRGEERRGEERRGEERRGEERRFEIEEIVNKRKQMQIQENKLRLCSLN